MKSTPSTCWVRWLRSPGGVRKIFRSIPPETLLLGLWLAINLVLLYAPFPLQRRLMLGMWIPLAALAAPKIADGMQALKWWKEGKMMEIAEYCCYDVKITKALHEYGKAYGEVHYVDRMGHKRSVKVKW